MRTLNYDRLIILYILRQKHRFLNSYYHEFGKGVTGDFTCENCLLGPKGDACDGLPADSHRRYFLCAGFKNSAQFPDFFGSVQLSDVRVIDFYRNAELQNPVVNPCLCKIIRIPDFIKGEVGCDNKGFSAAVAAVDHAENLLQRKFRISLYPKVVDYQKLAPGKAFDKPVFLLRKHSSKGVDDF